MTLFIDNAGNIYGVYNDLIHAMALSNLEISRASNVEFNHELQRWEATTPAGELLCWGPNRTMVITEEVRIITERLQQQLEVV